MLPEKFAPYHGVYHLTLGHGVVLRGLDGGFLDSDSSSDSMSSVFGLCGKKSS